MMRNMSRLRSDGRRPQQDKKHFNNGRPLGSPRMPRTSRPPSGRRSAEGRMAYHVTVKLYLVHHDVMS